MALSRLAGSLAGTARPRLLVVDDDPAVRIAFSLSLRRAGFDVTTAADGLAALDLLRRESFAVMLLDHGMPRLDGLGVLRRLQASGAELPVILISGWLDERCETEALGLGVTALLRKPPDLGRLVSLCRELANVAPGASRSR
jgi:two-component system response regulator MprA